MERLRMLRAGAATAVITASMVAGCSYGPASPPMAESRPANTSTGPAVVSIFPGTAALGTPLTAKGATVTPHADNLAVMRLDGGDDLELGIQVSITGVTAPIDVTGPDGGFRLYVSSGEQIPATPAAVLKQPPLASPVTADADGWVFFRITPGTHATQLQLQAAPAGYGLAPQSIAVWLMPDTLPGVAAPAPPPPPPGAAGVAGIRLHHPPRLR
ncbi:hypothetical protein, partial [Mycolicibacterium cosmeticum]|uniref:hypothetical protein n=1 Tax=Mycolicibacterium cosmeticum TaxID=258533 RepID=UPI0019D571A3